MLSRMRGRARVSCRFRGIPAPIFGPNPSQNSDTMITCSTWNEPSRITPYGVAVIGSGATRGSSKTPLPLPVRPSRSPAAWAFAASLSACWVGLTLSAALAG